MERPSIVLIMTDQQQAAASAREGFPLDTTPFLDTLARDGMWFNRAYTSAPVCGPARISMLTGRFPSAHRVRVNHHLSYATYEQDLVDVVRGAGYATAMIGKNHSHLTPNRVDHWFELSHEGGSGEGRTGRERAIDRWLTDLQHGVSLESTPFPLECQGPYRAVSDAQEWIRSLRGRPFFMWLSFAEPHSPYQVPEPYFSLFPPGTLPRVRAGREVLGEKGFKWQWTKWLGQLVYPDYDEILPRMRANYFGMLRLIDDQVKRFIEFLETEGIRQNTLLVFVSDHGDFVGEYGLMRKGPEMPEALMRIPLLFVGPGIRVSESPCHAHVSIVDIMPTLCEAINIPLPSGVQGRSLWPLLTGESYPSREFASVYSEQGFGGLHYTDQDVDTDNPDPEHRVIPGLKQGPKFDCLNSVSQSGTMRMLRRNDWKLVFDMQGRGRLYNLVRDPMELEDLYDNLDYTDVRWEMMAELLGWILRVQDSLPLPTKYTMKSNPRNYWALHR